MLRKSLGVFTAVLAALLLVGVAWASGNTVQDVSGSGSQVTPPSSNVSSSSGSLVTESTGTSPDASSTSSSVADNSTTSISLVDTSSTSTTVDATSSTSLDDGSTASTTVPAGSTSTTFDDNDREETRIPAPVNSGPTTYQVGTAGTVTVQVTGGQLVLIDAIAAAGWNFELDRADGREVKVEFESGSSDAKFEAKIDNGELRVRVEPN